MKFVISGHVIELEELKPDLDKAFMNLHAAYLGNQPYNLSEFGDIVIRFLDENPQPSNTHNKYFTNFTVIWNNYLFARNFVEAEHIWEIALAPVLNWETKNPGKRAHKGTAYYFWGKTALEHGDLDKGYALMHQAVEEDILTLAGTLSPDTPALAFATLNYEKTDQNYREWVIRQAKFVDDQISEYSKLYSRKFLLSDFRTKFLLNVSIQEVVFIFVFALARIIRLYSFPSNVMKSHFAAQLQANILFDIAMVIDSTIHEKNSAQWKFIDHAQFLSSHTGQRLVKSDLQQINANFDNDYSNTLEAAINGNLTLANGRKLSRIESDLVAVYGLRNHEAHNIASVPVVSNRYKELVQCSLNTLFASVDFLY